MSPAFELVPFLIPTGLAVVCLGLLVYLNLKD